MPAHDRVGDGERRRLVRLISLLSLLGTLSLGAVGYGIFRLQEKPATLGSQAPSSTLSRGTRAPLSAVLSRLGGGTPVELEALASGRPTVVNFFASWCSACAAELSSFATVARAEGPKVAFVGIDTNDADPTKALALLRRAKTPYPVGVDTPTLGLAAAFRVDNLPTTFFLDRAGHIVASDVGTESKGALVGEIDRIITKPAGRKK